MPSPHLYVDSADVNRIRANLRAYPWYAEAYESIRAECETMIFRGFSVPCESGYVFYNSCKRDNAILVFDPYDPENHVCPKCGMNYRDEPFQRAWNCSYHQWLAQMSLKLGICYLVGGNERYARAVRKMLLEYADCYPNYENNDNELGTTRIFQSTYIESIWLSYIAGGYDMTSASAAYTAQDRRRILELFAQSAAVIRDYDEKWNNRQAFNNSGMLAAAVLLEDDELLRYTLEGPHGFYNQMNHSVLEDGFWYEGDNYHFATLPSLVNMAEICLHNGIDLYHREFNGHTLEDLFAAPLKTLQPDGSFPSRKDSPYASTFSQRWYSGLYELAHRRYPGATFAQALVKMYANEPAAGQELLNAAGLMDVFEKVSARRSDLDWRGFLTAEPSLMRAGEMQGLKSVDMRGTGLAVLRQDRGESYLSVDYGHYGGGHGHPDRLALTWFARGRRWLCDYGTGNYYFDHLRWYRSTIGHNTVAVDGRNHLPVEGECALLAEGTHMAAAVCEVEGIAPGVAARRTCALLGQGILIDVFQLKGDSAHRYDYALHGFGLLAAGGRPELAPPEGEAYSFLQNWRRLEALQAAFETDAARMNVHFAAQQGMVLRSADAYGPPTEIPARFPVLIASQKGERAFFAAAMEDVPAGDAPQVKHIEAIGEDELRVDFLNGEWVRLLLADGVCAIWGRGERAKRFEAFGVHSVKGVCRFAFAPEAAEGTLSIDGEWQLAIRGRCGQIDAEAPVQIVSGMKNCREVAAELENPCVYEGRWTQLMLDTINGGPLPAVLTDEDFQASDGVHLKMEPIRLAAGERRRIPVLASASGAKRAFFRFAGREYPLKVRPLFEAEAYADHLDAAAPLKIRVRNCTDEELRFSATFAEPFALSGGETRVFGLPMEHPCVNRQAGRASLEWSVCAAGMEKSGRLERALIVPERGGMEKLAANSNIAVCGPDHVARTEKRWQGPADLSAEGALLVRDGESLALRLRVKDDCVLFAGGKFPFDNDSVELFVDRSGPEYRNQDFTPDGCYGVQFMGGSSGDVSRARPLRGALRAPEKIAVSMALLPDGYELTADIPFECLGGRPEPGELWGFDLLVNDRDSGVRRDQQLIWSDCMEPDERIYLREDHHDPRRFGWLYFAPERGREREL